MLTSYGKVSPSNKRFRTRTIHKIMGGITNCQLAKHFSCVHVHVVKKITQHTKNVFLNTTVHNIRSKNMKEHMYTLLSKSKHSKRELHTTTQLFAEDASFSILSIEFKVLYRHIKRVSTPSLTAVVNSFWREASKYLF